MNRLRNKLLWLVGLVGLIMFGYMYLTKTNWMVLDEDNNYVNVIKKSEKPVLLVVVPINKHLWRYVIEASKVAAALKKVDGRIAILLPVSVNMILETAMRVKGQYNLELDIYLAPDALWKKLFGMAGDNIDSQKELEPTYIFVKNGKEIGREKGEIDWLSDNGADVLDKMFDIKLSQL